MLRGSSQARGDSVELRAVVDGGGVDSQVPAGAALIRFTEAVLRGAPDPGSARDEVVRSLGTEALIDAAGVVGNFMRMVRIADSTGIPVDGRMAEISVGIRDELNLNAFPSARLGD